MKFCSSCGWNNADTAVTCKCGKPLAVTAARAAARVSPSRVAAHDGGEVGPNKGKAALTLLSGIVILGLALFSFAMGSSPFAGVGGMIGGVTLIARGLKNLIQQRSAGSHEEPGPSPWRQPWKAFYSSAFYGTVARRTRGMGARYLLALEAGLWIISAFLAYSAARRAPGPTLDSIVAQVPKVTIRDGKAQVDAQQPYYLRFDEGAGQKAVVFDTTGQITAIDTRPEILALLTVNKLHIRSSNGQIRIHDLSGTKSFDLSADLLRGWIARYTAPALSMIYVVWVIGAFLYRLAQAVIYGGIGLLLASAFTKTLTFAESYRVAIAALTPMILMDSILGWMNVKSASGLLWWMACVVVTLGYLAFGVRSADESD